MSPAEKNNLSGLTFLSTRPQHQAKQLSTLLASRGASVIEFPTLEIVPVSKAEQEQFVEALVRLEPEDWVFFTSSNGVEQVMLALSEYSPQVVECLQQARIAVIGEATKEALEKHGLRAAFCSETANSEALGKEFLELIQQESRGGDERRMALLLRARTGSSALPLLLEEAEFQVIARTVYDSVLPKVDERKLQHVVGMLVSRSIAGIVFTSSETAKNFVSLLENYSTVLAAGWRHELVEIPVFVIGPRTSETVEGLGFRHVFAPPQARIESLVETISGYSFQKSASIGEQ